jgi:cytidine deaminase
VFTISIEIEVYPNILLLSDSDQELLAAAKKATANAYAPYSKFFVGSAFRLASKQIISASNQENAVYPQGSCAERSALFYIGANYPNQAILAVAGAAHREGGEGFIPLAPCGACRQALLEYEIKQHQPIRILLPGPEGRIYVVPSVRSLLPLAFDRDYL